MSKYDSFDPNPPECFSQVYGAALSDAYKARADKLAAEGRFLEANEAYTLALAYGGFRRLVQ